MQVSLVKIKITADMIGKQCLLAADESTEKGISSLAWGEVNSGEIKTEGRSSAQNGLYWACCDLVSENWPDEKTKLSWDSREKVSDQCKIQQRWYKGFFYYKNKKTGLDNLQIQFKSISFKECEQADASGYYTGSFEYMALLLNITKDELIEHAKLRMKRKIICTLCGNKAVHKHHYYEDSKPNRDKYGKLLQEEFNKIMLCPDCHSSHANVPKYMYWNETLFIAHALKNGYDPANYVDEYYRIDIVIQIEKAQAQYPEICGDNDANASN